MLASRKRSTPLLLALALVALILWYHGTDPDRTYAQWRSSFESHSVKLAANRTLGFGAVVAVSKEGSTRRHGLLQAANVTDFDIVIPTQPSWTEGDVEQFFGESAEGEVKHRGSILAWLGHHNALRWYVARQHASQRRD